MKNHWASKDYVESATKTLNGLKKSYDHYLEFKCDAESDSEADSSDYSEEVIPNNDVLQISYQNHSFKVPAALCELNDNQISALLNTICLSLTSEDLILLKPYLPISVSGSLDESGLKSFVSTVINGKIKGFMSPVKNFEDKLKNGVFTKVFQKQQILENKLMDYRRLKYLEDMLFELKKKLGDQNNPNYLDRSIKKKLKANSSSVMNKKNKDPADSEESIRDIINDDIFLDGVEGDTTYDSNFEDTGIISTSGQTFNLPEVPPNLAESKKKTVHSGSHQSNIIQNTSELPSKTNNNTNSGGNKVQKQVGRLKASREWIQNYRSQETERYKNPTKPWTYYLEDGVKATVAPVAKKIPINITKPRDHPLLKNDRPPFITILSLVRDAACRLPDGTGTRADICELIKESQFVNENLPDDKLSNIVSGALDRLHYEDDPCVRYDPEQKLWIYLHRERSENFCDWVDTENKTKKDSNNSIVLMGQGSGKAKHKRSKIKVAENSSIKKIEFVQTKSDEY